MWNLTLEKVLLVTSPRSMRRDSMLMPLISRISDELKLISFRRLRISRAVYR